MVQSYGVAADRDYVTETIERHDATAVSPLLGDGAQGNNKQRQGASEYGGGHASIPSCVGNLCNTIMGEGPILC